MSREEVGSPFPVRLLITTNKKNNKNWLSAEKEDDDEDDEDDDDDGDGNDEDISKRILRLVLGQIDFSRTLL